jgi:hypothetical protein
MKARIIIASLLMFSVTLAMSQDMDRRIRFGVTGGVNFQNLNGNDRDGSTLDYSVITGFNLGVNTLIPIAPEFHFQPGLLFTTKGARNDAPTPDITYRLSYIELPLNLVYRGLLGTGFVLIGFGPYAAYAVGGRVMEGDASRDITFTSTVAAGEPLTNYYFRRFDLGGNLFLGYELGMGLVFQLNTQLGMIRINPEDNRFPDLSMKNTGFGFAVGYRF